MEQEICPLKFSTSGKEPRINVFSGSEMSIQKSYIALIVLIIGLYLVPGRITGPDFDGMPGDLGDSRFNNYILEHGYKCVAGEEEYFWGAPFMYPEGNVITLADNLLGVMPAYSFFRVLGFDRETSFQLLFWLICILNFCCTYFVLKKWTGNTLAAASGAFVFAFGIPVVAQINHMQLLSRFFVPLCFYFWYSFLNNGRVKNAVLTALFFAGQFYCSMYLGFMLFVVISVFTGVYVLINYRKSVALLKEWKSWLGLFVGAITCGILIYPLYHKYAARAAEIGMRPWNEVEPLLPRFSSFHYAGENSWLWSWVGDNKGLIFPWEHVLFPGMIAVLAIPVLCVLIYRGKIPATNGKLILASISSVFILVLLFISVNGHTLYYYLYKFPGFGSMRAPLRVQLLILFLFSVLVAMLVVQAQEWGKKWRPSIVVILIVVLIVADQGVGRAGLIQFSKSESQLRIQPILESLKNFDTAKHKAFMYMPEEGLDPGLVQLDAMMAAQTKGVKTVNGYSSSAPPGYWLVWSKYYDKQSLTEWLNFKGYQSELDQIFIVGGSKNPD